MTAQLALTLPQARQAGMEAAADHAGHEWITEAYTYLCAYARDHAGPFIPEDVSDAHIAAGMNQPPDLRSWAALWQRASRERVVAVVDNNGRSRRRGSECKRYRSLVCRSA